MVPGVTTANIRDEKMHGMAIDGGNTRQVTVYLERGTRRVFACSLEWPGWCRSAKTPELAIAELARYAPRYAAVPAAAGIRFDPGASDLTAPEAFAVAESVPGGTSTDFGAPCEIPDSDTEPVDTVAAERQAALVTAAWDLLADVAAASPAQLRKGPRGGGRDRDKMLAHVVAAEAAYARRIGVRHRPPAFDDEAAVAAMRTDILAVLGAPSGDGPVAANGWPTRYAARRIAWHALDHAWEMQDRAES
jgi:hypothetical protein